MRALEFFRALIEHGRVRVEPPRFGAASGTAANDLPSESENDVAAELRDWDAVNRKDFPGAAPPLIPDAAHWAFRQFHLACQFATYRDLGAAQIDAALTVPCPTNGLVSDTAAARHYSVDLVFRFLPDLYRLAKSAAEGDPLCNHLRRWSVEWPLSSVGMTCANPIDPTAVCMHPGLLQLYVDRIIARRDTSRLADPRVRTALRATLGHFDELSPPLAAALQSYDRAEVSRDAGSPAIAVSASP